jgi:hypothetical protein
MNTRKLIGYGLLVAGLAYIAKKSSGTKTKRTNFVTPLTEAQHQALITLQNNTPLTLRT